MNTLFEFFSFHDTNIRYVTAGTVLLGVSAAVIGCFLVLRKRALVGDAVSHSILPGVALAFIVFQVKNPLLLLAGAFVAGWVSTITMDLIIRYSRIKPDTAIGLVLSVFFGLGILLITNIQSSGNAAQAGLDSFLFGKAASILKEDVIIFGLVCIGLLLLVQIFFKEFFLISFDPDHASVIGIPVRFFEFLLTSVTVLAIAVGIQAVGVILMAALLITPAVSARFWTHNLKHMTWLAAIFGAIGGITGSYVSFMAPNMPTGPWIVVMLTLVAIVSMVAAPGYGLVPRWLKRRHAHLKVLDENVLKLFYQLGENRDNMQEWYTMDELMERKGFNDTTLKQGLKRGIRKDYILNKDGRYKLTNEGLKAGQQIVRLHRLWELYLTTYMNIAPDHVHEDADAIEHVITPEIEARLEQLLDFPERDPHDSVIPKRML